MAETLGWIAGAFGQASNKALVAKGVGKDCGGESKAQVQLGQKDERVEEGCRMLY